VLIDPGWWWVHKETKENQAEVGPHVQAITTIIFGYVWFLKEGPKTLLNNYYGLGLKFLRYKGLKPY
jgi:hypothetical protein